MSETIPTRERPAPERATVDDDAPQLTDLMIDSYWRDGYVVVPRLLDPESLQRWLDRLAAIVDGEVPPSQGMLVMKDVMVAKGAVTPGSRLEAVAKIQDYEKDPVLWSYVTDARLLGCVERLIGRDVFSVHTMLINKPPHVDGRHPLHQDLLYFPFRPADRIVASWTALEPVTVENGCLVVVPGTHRGELLPHENPDWEWLNRAYWGARGVGADERREHLEMQPGDTVLFHPLLLHGSGRNRTEGFRRAISAHYASCECEWAWTTRDVARPYTVVNGAHAGERWSGRRRADDDAIDPLRYLPIGAPSGAHD